MYIDIEEIVDLEELLEEGSDELIILTNQEVD
jgi:hypothetical protein